RAWAGRERNRHTRQSMMVLGQEWMTDMRFTGFDRMVHPRFKVRLPQEMVKPEPVLHIFCFGNDRSVLRIQYRYQPQLREIAQVTVDFLAPQGAHGNALLGFPAFCQSLNQSEVGFVR